MDRQQVKSRLTVLEFTTIFTCSQDQNLELHKIVKEGTYIGRNFLKTRMMLLFYCQLEEAFGRFF